MSLFFSLLNQSSLVCSVYTARENTGIPTHVTLWAILHTLLYKYPKAGNSFRVIK